MNWYIGQRIVCVQGLSARRYRSVRFSAVNPGEIYTIREIYTALNGFTCFRLREIVNPKIVTRYRGLWELGYRSYRFRPLLDRPTDISVFTSLLNQKELVE